VVLPDILANAGGVTAGWFEWVQNRQHYQWGLDRVRGELDRILGQAFEQVWQLSASRQVPLRTARSPEMFARNAAGMECTAIRRKVD
jgi:glutamate dehydrogenase/leucine dehydrogenase